MTNDYVVYKGEAYPDYSYDKNGRYLYSSDERKLSEGFEVAPDSTPERPLYRKYVLDESIEQRYCIVDSAIINGREYGIAMRSDENYDQPDSWVSVVTDDAEALNDADIWEGAQVVVEKYAHKFYYSDKIPVSQVKIVRTRIQLPI